MTREEREFAKSRIEYLLKINSFVFDERDKQALDMAIQALSQEPTVTSTDEPMTMVYPTIVCDDAINRQAVKDILNNSYSLTDAEHRVEQLPSVTQKSGKWIPVSKRLPEDGTYLVTVERIDGEPRIDIKSFAKDLYKVDEFDFPKHKCGWYEYDSEWGYWEDTNVIAWMPLPEPYKAEGSNKE